MADVLGAFEQAVLLAVGAARRRSVRPGDSEGSAGAARARRRRRRGARDARATGEQRVAVVASRQRDAGPRRKGAPLLPPAAGRCPGALNDARAAVDRIWRGLKWPLVKAMSSLRRPAGWPKDETAGVGGSPAVVARRGSRGRQSGDLLETYRDTIAPRAEGRRRCAVRCAGSRIPVAGDVAVGADVFSVVRRAHGLDWRVPTTDFQRDRRCDVVVGTWR